MKDNIKAKFINELRDTAIKYKDSQQLRFILREVVIKYMGLEWWLEDKG